jgi:protein-S-isoprenylcysteine O-methyltransferase Ste14
MNEKSKIIHYTLVFVQFAGILYFALSGASFPQNALVLKLQAISVVLGFWAIIAMKLHTLSVLPSVKQGGQLCTSGPYHLLRHPMYTAVLLLLFALLLNDYSTIRLVVYLIVFIDLILKMNVEEKILLAHYTEYKNYMTKTKRIIPFLY